MKPNKKNSRIFLSPPHMGGQEEELIAEAFRSKYIAPTGPMADRFEKEFAKISGSKYALAVSSGTAAMHLALRVLKISAGDVVMASTLTFIGSVSPIIFLGAQPYFIDSDKTSWNMDPDILEDALQEANKNNRRPKAVIPTDLYGQSADIDRIKEVCDSHEIPVICDAAESLGATYKGTPAGSRAFAAIHSFNGNKIITTSGGGMLTSNDRHFIEKARYYSQQAREPFSHYEHTEIGYNYRMSNILAAIGVGQLKVLKKRVEKKEAIYLEYKERLADIDGIDFMPIAEYGHPNYWLTVILINKDKFGVDREYVRCKLEENNIESRPVWKPMHMQPAFKDCHNTVSGVAELLFRRGLCLPSGTALTEQQVSKIVEIIIGCKKD